MIASAGQAERLLLIEVNGPWGPEPLRDSRFDRSYAGRLARAAAQAGVRLQLVRRPGRHVDGDRSGQDDDGGEGWWYAIADLRAGQEAVAWDTWSHPRRLLDLHLRAPVEPSGPQHVALVCTHGRHDLCCALDGRPVADALARHVPEHRHRAGPWDVWETTHLGGDRFAANLLLLPTGDLFGGLTPETAVAVVDRYTHERLDLAHHRGRFGTSGPHQAATHHALTALGLDRPSAIEVAVAPAGEHRWRAEVTVTDTGRRYALTLAARWSEPAVLTCASAGPTRVRRYDVVQPLTRR
jgi:hypothetical protein